ncbi:MAG: STAS domain-containing protein [Planctomycetes bacterium]|nr:STAS domain-containing protein [Planctomycetota bacterium]MBL7039184.1 STAS domain-containing protein [Pirellulaceae bacterium]
MLSEYEYFDVLFEDEVAIIRLADPQFFNTDDYSDLQEEFRQFAEEVRPPLLVVDFRHVTYCSTALISGLIGMQQRLATHGGKVKLSGLYPAARDIFRSLRLEQTVFDIYETTGAALIDC